MKKVSQEQQKCFFIGKIISNIEFKFILNSKNISIAIFEIELENKSTIKAKGFSEIADKCYSKFNKGNVVAIQGEITSQMEIIINVIMHLLNENNE